MTALARVLSRLGLRPRPFRALARALLLMDIRSQHYGKATGTKPGEVIPPLFWVVGQYILASGVLALVLFTRVDAWAFAFAGLTTSLLLIATAIVVEFNEVVLSPDDLTVIGHRPVPERTYALVRLANLGFFVGLLTAALTVFPAVLGAAQRDASLTFFLLYIVASVSSSLIVTCAIIILYSFVDRGSTGAGVRDVLAWTQIILILVIGYGAQWMWRDSGLQLQRFFARPPDWIHWLPSAWLADYVVGGPSREVGATLRSTIVLAVLSVLSVLLTAARLSVLYRTVRGGSSEPEVASRAMTPRPLVGGVSRSLGRSRAHGAVVALCLTMLRRDRDLRMRTLPSLATVLAIVILGLTGSQLGNPFRDEIDSSLVSIAALQLLVLTVPVMLHNMSFSHDHESAWVLTTAPSSSRPGDAARVAVCYGVALPVLLMLGALLAWHWRDPVAALVHALFGWIEILAVGHATVRAVSLDLPFARPAARGDVMGSVAPWLAALSTLAMGVGALQAYVSGPTAPGGGFLLLGHGVFLLVLWYLARSWSLVNQPSTS